MEMPDKKETRKATENIHRCTEGGHVEGLCDKEQC